VGPSHSSVLMESGHLYTFGDNRYGQLGHGNLKSIESPACVKSLVGKHVTVGHRSLVLAEILVRAKIMVSNRVKRVRARFRFA
jgi:alpha-tubulin suppressor-like RCC1 family protein